MVMFKRVGDFFGLDIGTKSIRVVQLGLRNNKDGAGAYFLKHYGYLDIDPKIAKSSSEADKRELAEAINTVVGQSGIKTKNIAVGLPSDKTFTTIIEVANQTKSELEKTVKYRANEFIPMPIEEAKVDWADLGQSLKYPDKKEVLLASTAIEYSELKLEFLENLGYNVVAFEPDQIAMSRSLNINDGSVNVIVELGENNTDLTIIVGNTPRLVRSIPIGFSSIIKAAISGLNIKEDQARQFILKFGLSTDKLEGKVYQAIEGTLDNFASEINKSINFFQSKYPEIKVNRIILSGYSSIIPSMNQYIANYTKLAVTIGSSWQNVFLTPEQQAQLANSGAYFAVAVGLAERSNYI